MSEETQRWKKKYLNKLDELDALKTSFGEQKTILERLLVRVSLAAEGLDKNLDNELASLRSLIRQENAGAPELNRQLQVIEKHVLEMDENREDLTGSLVHSLTQLAEQILACNISRGQRKALKSFKKQIPARSSDVRHYPSLFRDLSDLQGNALADITKAPGNEGQSGLFGKLFRGRNDSTRQNTTDDSYSLATGEEKAAESDSKADMSTHTDPTRTVNKEIDQTPHQDPSEPDGESIEPGFSAVADHVCATLASMVKDLQVPETMEKDVLRIREKVTKGLNWYELVPALDDTANLVIAAFGRGQKEFESFLKSLDARLVSVQSFLEINRNSRDLAARNKVELQQEVQSHLTSIQQDVSETEDVSSLKTAVQADLDAMLVALERYMRKESSREDEMVAKMAELQNRLQAMESDSMEMQQQLVDQQQKAMTDGLTGLPNRVAYEDRAKLEFERWRRYGNPLTLVVADIDRFKRVNDQYGHLSGDKVIQLIGKEVVSRIRKTDFVARYGGEEFVIILPETTAQVAFEVMDKTREMISRMPFHFQNEKVQITVSMGICEFCAEMEIQDAFELADKALYQAKSAGRNQLCLAESGK